MSALPFRQRTRLDHPQLDLALRELMPVIAAVADAGQQHSEDRAEALVEALRRFQRLDRKVPALRALERWQDERDDRAWKPDQRGALGARFPLAIPKQRGLDLSDGLPFYVVQRVAAGMDARALI